MVITHVTRTALAVLAFLFAASTAALGQAAVQQPGAHHPAQSRGGEAGPPQPQQPQQSQGMGMMGPQMRGQGMGMMEMMRSMMEHQGAGKPGMSGPMMGHPGMGPSYGRGHGMVVVPIRHLGADEVRHFLEHWIAEAGNSRLKVGDVKEIDDEHILADIVTREGALVDRLQIERHSGEADRVE